MILAKDIIPRERALQELIIYQQKDFEDILKEMDGLPVTVRLLDPPLHEFLPHAESIDETFASEVGMSVDECIETINGMKEVNPMLGLRGCRLGIMMPDLIQMQVRALTLATLRNKYEKGLNPVPEIMIPLIGSVEEYKNQAKLISETIAATCKEYCEKNKNKDYTVNIKIGTMIEVPRAALTAAGDVSVVAQY